MAHVDDEATNLLTGGIVLERFSKLHSVHSAALLPCCCCCCCLPLAVSALLLGLPASPCLPALPLQYVHEVYQKLIGGRFMGAFYNGSGALLANQVVAIVVIIGWTGEGKGGRSSSRR